MRKVGENTSKWKFTWGMGCEKSWPEAWQRGLTEMGEAARLATIKLLATKKFRSGFRQSMRDRIVSWFETTREERQFQSPLSPRQWECVIDAYTAREAKQISSELYRAGRYE